MKFGFRLKRQTIYKASYVINIRTTSERVTLVPIFYFIKISHLLPCSSFSKTGHAALLLFACGVLKKRGALRDAHACCQPVLVPRVQLSPVKRLKYFLCGLFKQGSLENAVFSGLRGFLPGIFPRRGSSGFSPRPNGTIAPCLTFGGSIDDSLPSAFANDG